MKKQKGQSLVEFTLVMPFFFLLVFGLIYSGMLFYDYSTLSNVARSAARERAITPTVKGKTIDQQNTEITEYYYKNGKFVYGLVTSLYNPPDPPENAMVISGPTTDGDITVTITMVLGNSSYLMRQVVPQRYSVVYHMRKDYTE